MSEVDTRGFSTSSDFQICRIPVVPNISVNYPQVGNLDILIWVTEAENRGVHI